MGSLGKDSEGRMYLSPMTMDRSDSLEHKGRGFYASQKDLDESLDSLPSNTNDTTLFKEKQIKTQKLTPSTPFQEKSPTQVKCNNVSEPF